jgi:monovalent cation:H+ antiporter-2, CPA2 family
VLIELGGVILGLAFVARLAGRLTIPPIPLYLLVGLAFGEGGIFPLATTEEFVRVGAEIGLILVLFMLGLEHPARELVDEMGRSAKVGALDLVMNLTPGLIAGFLLGWPLASAAFLGVATYVTSSGVAGRLLQDLKVPRTTGRSIVSLLVLEDLGMALLLPVLGALIAGGDSLRSAVTAFVAIAAVVAFLALSLRLDVGVSRLLFNHSDEVLLLTILGFGLLFAGFAELVEVSTAVGALLAGVMLSGPTAKKAGPLLTPLRDLFAAMFFAFIGLSVDPAALPPVMLTAIILAVITSATKVVTGYIAAGRVTSDKGIRTLAGGIMVARGEFSLAVAGLAVAAQVRPSPAPLILAYVVLLAVAGPLVARVVEQFRPRPPMAPEVGERSLS